MSPPAGLPDLFIDRSLGRIKVPQLLRAAGLRLTTLAERYGIPADEDVADEDWLRDAGERGEVVFMKDERIRYRPAEKHVVTAAAVRAFCLSRRDLDADAMAALFLDNLTRIAEISAREQACLYVISFVGLRRVDLTSSP